MGGGQWNEPDNPAASITGPTPPLSATVFGISGGCVLFVSVDGRQVDCSALSHPTDNTHKSILVLRVVTPCGLDIYQSVGGTYSVSRSPS